MPNLVAADMASSLTALNAILMALLAREKTGKGDYIDIAMYDSLIAWTPNITGPVFAEGKAPEPHQMRNYGGQAMNRIYETRDGQYIVLAGSEAKFSENLLRALGRLDFFEIAKGEPGPAQKPLIDFFTETFKSKTRAEWEAFLEPIDLCWAPVRSLKDGFEDENSATRQMLLRDAQGNPHIGPAIKFENEPVKPDFNLPEYGTSETNWKQR
jgi:crotonobetainyl-CoA:carnitine CoA-transferase CaiB-like acyl-CoA transferase